MENDQVITERADRERTLAARIAAHASWAVTPDREVRTRPARAAFLARFERQVDPNNLLPPQERHLRAESAKRAYFQSLALKVGQGPASLRSTLDVRSTAVAKHGETTFPLWGDVPCSVLGARREPSR